MARALPAAARVVMLATVGASLQAACSSRELYQASQGWRRSTCEGILEPERRAACLERADRDYDAYRRDREPPAK